jgi:hypothetical protein
MKHPSAALTPSATNSAATPPPDAPVPLSFVVGGTSLNFAPHERQKSYPGVIFTPHFPHLFFTAGILTTLSILIYVIYNYADFPYIDFIIF